MGENIYLEELKELSKIEKQIIAFSLFDRYIDSLHYHESSETENIKNIICKIGLDKYLPEKFENNKTFLFNKLNLVKEYNYLKSTLKKTNRIALIIAIANVILTWIIVMK